MATGLFDERCDLRCDSRSFFLSLASVTAAALLGRAGGRASGEGGVGGVRARRGRGRGSGRAGRGGTESALAPVQRPNTRATRRTSDAPLSSADRRLLVALGKDGRRVGADDAALVLDRLARALLGHLLRDALLVDAAEDGRPRDLARVLALQEERLLLRGHEAVRGDGAGWAWAWLRTVREGNRCGTRRRVRKGCGRGGAR